MNAFRLYTVIVEDELIIAEMLKEMLEDLGVEVVATVTNAEQFTKVLEDRGSFDLVFLDIKLRDTMSGIDIAEQLLKDKIPHIYLTSYWDDETMQKALRTHPVNYLVKPFSKATIVAALTLFRSITFHHDFMLLKDGRSLVKIRYEEIRYVETDGNYLHVVTDAKKYTLRESMSDFIAQKGNGRIVRIHRSFAVVPENVDKLHSGEVNIGRSHLPVSRTYHAELVERLKAIDK